MQQDPEIEVSEFDKKALEEKIKQEQQKVNQYVGAGNTSGLDTAVIALDVGTDVALLTDLVSPAKTVDAAKVTEIASTSAVDNAKENWSGIPDAATATDSSSVKDWSAVGDESPSFLAPVAQVEEKGFIDGALDTVSSAVDDVGTALVNAANVTQSTLGGIVDGAGNVASSVANSVGDAASGALDMAGSVASGALDVAGSVASGVGDVASGALSVAGDVAGVAGDVAGAVLKGVGSIFEGL